MPITREEWFRRLNAAAKEAAKKRDEMKAVLNGCSSPDRVFDEIIGFVESLSAMSLEAAVMRKEIAADNRKKKYAIRKLQGLVKTSAQRKAEKLAKLAEERAEQKARDEYKPESCECWRGYPPCSWCTDPRNDPDYIDASELVDS